jgi:hypothetical protein
MPSAERPIGTNIDGNLIGRATDAAALDLDARTHVAERTLPHLQRIILRSLRDHIERAVDDALGDAFLPSRMTTLTNFVSRRRMSDGASVYLGSGQDLALGYFTFTRA